MIVDLVMVLAVFLVCLCWSLLVRVVWCFGYNGMMLDTLVIMVKCTSVIIVWLLLYLWFWIVC